MQLRAALVVLAASALVGACSAKRDRGPDTPPTTDAPTTIASPLAPFARLVGGEWRVGFAGGASSVHAWRWGPGQHSMHKWTDGSDPSGGPWAVEVLYWHPGHRQVQMLALHGTIPGVGRGVGDGSIAFDGDTANGLMTLRQPRGPRKLGLRWAFEGPDAYHGTLLEDSGAGGMQPLAEWDFVRTPQGSTARRSGVAADPSTLPEHFKAFDVLVGRAWETLGPTAEGEAPRVRTTYEWVPSLEVITARTMAPGNGGEPEPVLDAYFYQAVGSEAVRCLVLSRTGGVYEGDVTTDAGALHLNLTGSEGDRAATYVVRFDLEKDGTLRQRVWAVVDGVRTLTLDVRSASTPQED